MRRSAFILALAAAAAVASASPAIAALLRPTLLTVRALGADTLELRWKDNSLRETGFEIERSASATTGFVHVGATAKNVAIYVDAGLASGTYYYRVRAVGRRPRAASPWSNVATGVLAADRIPPSTPTGVSATAVGCARVDVAWSASTDAPGGRVASYRVRRNGVLRAEIAAPALTATDQAVEPATQYAYGVTAVDAAGNESAPSAPAPVATPACANRPPVADAGPDQFAQTLTPLAFDGQRSTDPDGRIVAWAWTFGDGTTAGGATPSHAYGRAGTYTATLTVTDDRGGVASDSATVTIANRAPIADAGPDRAAGVGTAVAFDGSRSTDPDGQIASYAWTFGDGGAATGASTGHVYAQPGSFAATLTVTDDRGTRGSDTALVSIAPAPVPGWSRAAGGTGDDRGLALAVDANGNLALTGYFSGTVDFGGGPFTSEHISYLDPNQFKDVFLASYTPAGVHRWSRRLGADSDDRGNAVAVDPSGDVVVAGMVNNYVDFGNGVLTNAAGGPDAFVAKYAGVDGHHLWSRRFGDAGIDGAYGVATDADGNVIVVGQFEGTVDFGAGRLTSVGGLDVFVVKLSPAGVPLWAKRFGGAAFDYGYAVAADAAGNVVVTGAFIGSIDCGGGPLAGAGGFDGFVVELSPTGAHRWSRRVGGSADDYAYGVAVDAGGNAFLTGYFQGSAAFGGASLTSAGAADAFLVKLSPTGGHLWSKRLGGAGDDRGQAVTVDGQGDVAVTGSFQDTTDFGGGPLTPTGIDVFVAEYSSAGAHRRSLRLGGAGVQSPGGVAVQADGTLSAAGYFQYTVTFPDAQRTSAGSFDAFLTGLGR